LEETEINAKYLGMIGFRETREYINKKSDVYFVALLRPLNQNQEVGTGDGEVSKVMWVKIDEYVAFDWTHPTQTVIKDMVIKIVEAIRSWKIVNGG